MPFSTLSRLVRRIFQAPTTRPITRSAFKPSLEALDPRVMPALFTWTDATGDNQYSDPYNWQNTAGVVSIPAAYDDILFPNNAGTSGGSSTGGGIGAGGPSGGSNDCYGMQSDPNGPFNSITITAGYTGTVTVTGPVQTLALYLNNGTIDQPAGAGSDITVLGGAALNAYAPWVLPSWDGGSDFNWTGGTLDSTNSGATLHITGTNTLAVIDPLNAGSQSTGDTLSIEGGATANFMPGTVIFTGGEGIDIAEGCTVEDFPAPDANVTKSVGVNETATDIQITNLGNYIVTGPGADISRLPITVSSGILRVVSNATATFQGTTYSSGGLYPVPLGSVYNNGGVVIIESGSTLVPQMGMTQSSGMLRLKITANGGISTLDGDLNVGGGVVQFTYDQAPLNGEKSNINAKFVVTGDVVWTGGTYIPWVDLAHPREGSKWNVQQTMTIGAFATIAPQFINAAQKPAGVSGWWVIYSDQPIYGTPRFDSTIFQLVNDGKQIVVKK